MKKLNVYSVYLDDGKDVFRVTVPAASKKDAAEYVRGGGALCVGRPGLFCCCCRPGAGLFLPFAGGVRFFT